MIVGIGTDIVKVKRIKLNNDNSYKYLGAKENDIFNNDWSVKRKKQFLAGRWAAKEAIYKALPVSNYKFKDFDIYNEDEKPVITLDGYTIRVSISHEDEYAIAFAIVEK